MAEKLSSQKDAAEKKLKEKVIIYITMYIPAFSWFFLLLFLSNSESEGQTAVQTGEAQGHCSQDTSGRRQGEIRSKTVESGRGGSHFSIEGEASDP